VIALKSFRPEVMVEVPGCPTPMIDSAVRQAVIEFCDFTFTWQREAVAADIQTDPDKFVYLLPEEARIVTLGFQQTGCHSKISERGRCIASWHYTADDTAVVITVSPAGVADEDVNFAFALKPTQDAQNVPKNVYRDNLSAIASGAKARLLAMPGKSWSNPQLSAYYKDEFERAKRKEKAEVLNGYTRHSTLSIRPATSLYRC